MNTNAKEIMRDIKELRDRWNDHCEDTGCVPDDFRIDTTGNEARVYFEASTWARKVSSSIEALLSGNQEGEA